MGAPFLASEAIAAWRRIIAEPYQDRWQDVPDGIAFLSDAQRSMARELRCIEGRIGWQTQLKVPEYVLPELVAIKRVYMCGPGFAQRLRPTSVPMMEGDDLRLYDNQGTNFSPVWTTLPPAPYPVASCVATIGYTPGPRSFIGSPPEYYLRGVGVIGVSPPPLAVYMLVLDTIVMPDEVTATTQELLLIRDMREALAWYMGYLAYSSDKNIGSDSLAADAMANFTRQLGKHTDWAKNINEDEQNAMAPLTHRAFYQACHDTRWGDWWD